VEESAAQFFELVGPMRQYGFMTVAVKAVPARAAEIPAVVHVDGTARALVVQRESNPRYWELISRFGKDTGVPVLLNTSFNVRGQPIVCTPDDAINCFLSTDIEVLALGDWVATKQ
jgi:predicted NodU family carbamoyl transferase